MAWWRAAALATARGRCFCAFVWLPALKNAAISKSVENSQHCGGGWGRWRVAEESAVSFWRARTLVQSNLAVAFLACRLCAWRLGGIGNVTMV